MEINFSTFNLLESVIYRANIFNYDNKFLASIRETNSPFQIKYDGKKNSFFLKIIKTTSHI